MCPCQQLSFAFNNLPSETNVEKTIVNYVEPDGVMDQAKVNYDGAVIVNAQTDGNCVKPDAAKSKPKGDWADGMEQAMVSYAGRVIGKAQTNGNWVKPDAGKSKPKGDCADVMDQATVSYAGTVIGKAQTDGNWVKSDAVKSKTKGDCAGVMDQANVEYTGPVIENAQTDGDCVNDSRKCMNIKFASEDIRIKHLRGQQLNVKTEYYSRNTKPLHGGDQTKKYSASVKSGDKKIKKRGNSVSARTIDSCAYSKVNSITANSIKLGGKINSK